MVVIRQMQLAVIICGKGGASVPKVSICTAVYNAGEYLKQCVSSVLTQTFPDFQYIIIDNGSTDGSVEILETFRRQDPRIQLIYSDNTVGTLQFMEEYATGDYYTYLDHDDWLDSTYLEHLLDFSEKNNLDIACIGTCMHHMRTLQLGFRKLEQPLILGRKDFPLGFPYYHQFFRTNWGKLIRSNIAEQIHQEDINDKVAFGSDTVYCFQLLRRAERIGIDTPMLHHYRIHPSSQSYQYSPGRFESDVYRYEDAQDFLLSFGEISPQNQLFIERVFASAILDDLQVIANSSLSPHDKLKEYRAIAEHCITQSVYQQKEEDIQRSRQTLFSLILQEGVHIIGENADLQTALKVLAPRCCDAALKDIGLFLKDTESMQALLHDDGDSLLQRLIYLIEKKQYIKQFNLCSMLSSLIPNKSPMHIVTNDQFFARYSVISNLILHEQYFEALDKMTEYLLKKEDIYYEDIFLEIYLTLAALENQVLAFLFGKIRFAKFYQRKGFEDKCKEVIEELESMGAGEQEDVLYLKQRIKSKK